MTDTKHRTKVTLLIDRDTDEYLTRIANELGLDRNDIANDALIEWLEDLEDIAAADQVLRDGYVRYTEVEVRKRLGLEG